jgi:hypothetical protein
MSTAREYVIDGGVRTCTLFFFYSRFACTGQLVQKDIEWVRYVFPVSTAIEPVFVSVFLGTCQLHTRALQQNARCCWERKTIELRVIAMTIQLVGICRGKALWMNGRRQSRRLAARVDAS